MYTVLPKDEEEFESMVNQVLSGYEFMKLTTELIHRINIDLNMLLRESKLEIVDHDKNLRVSGYLAKRSDEDLNVLEIGPIWEPY